MMGENNQFSAKNAWSSVWNNVVKSRKLLENINIPFEDVMCYEEYSDNWVSSFVRDGEFYVAALRDRIERASFPVCSGNFSWLKLVPIKVLGFIWNAKQN